MTQELHCMSPRPLLEDTTPSAVERSFEARQLPNDVNEVRECIAGFGVATAVIRK